MAAIVATLFCHTAHAKKANKESYLDIVEKAQNLVINKDRSSAVALLNQAILKEGTKSSSGKELIKFLNQITHVFLLESTQQLYETAMSNWITNYAVALEKLNAAYKSEPENLSVISLKVRAHINTGDCSEAKNFIKKFDELNPYDEDMSLLYAQVYICEKKYEDFYKLYQVSGIDNLAWLSILILYQSVTQPSQMPTLFEKIKKIDKNFPELYYWEWKFTNAKQDFAKKYLNVCKNMSDLNKRSLIKIIYLCGGLSEVEKNIL